jgi:hypothetical protein
VELFLFEKALLNDTVDFRSGHSLSAERIKQIPPRAPGEPPHLSALLKKDKRN